MARRYFSSTAAQTTLAGAANGSTTTLAVAAATNFPSLFPYTLIIDPDTVNEELVEVTNRSGTTLTVTRGVDGTSGVAHSAGAVVKHGVSARDFDEPNAFLNNAGTTNVGTSGTISASGLAGSLLSSATPSTNSGSGSAGTSAIPARDDHTHPVIVGESFHPFLLIGA